MLSPFPSPSHILGCEHKVVLEKNSKKGQFLIVFFLAVNIVILHRKVAWQASGKVEPESPDLFFIPRSHWRAYSVSLY